MPDLHSQARTEQASCLFLQARAMEMYVSPASALALPDACLRCGDGAGFALGADALDQPGIADHGHVAHDTNVRRTNGRLMPPVDAAEVEVEAMKRQALHQLPRRLGLKCGKCRITQLLIAGPVAGRDRV